MYTPTYKPNGNEVAVIKTSKGTIKVEVLRARMRPIASANFIELALKGFYNGIKFHRYVPGFVIQGGDPQTKTASAPVGRRADAAQQQPVRNRWAGLHHHRTSMPHNPNKHVDGALAMARTQRSELRRVAVLLRPRAACRSLDGQYTVFGQATSGLDVIHKLRAVT